MYNGFVILGNDYQKRKIHETAQSKRHGNNTIGKLEAPSVRPLTCRCLAVLRKFEATATKIRGKLKQTQGLLWIPLAGPLALKYVYPGASSLHLNCKKGTSTASVKIFLFELQSDDFRT